MNEVKNKMNQLGMINNPINEFQKNMMNFQMNQMGEINQMNQMDEINQMNQMKKMEEFINKNEKKEEEFIDIIFRASEGKGKPVLVICKRNEKVSDAIEKYRIKSGDNDMSKKFIYDARALYPSLTIFEANLTNNSNIFVVSIKGVQGRKNLNNY